MSDEWPPVTDPPWEDPEVKEWAGHVRETLIPMIRDSRFSVSLVPEDPRDVDVKFAVELGFMIMLDKPIVAVVQPGTKVPDKLVRVADKIIEWSHSVIVAQEIADFVKEMRLEGE